MSERERERETRALKVCGDTWKETFKCNKNRQPYAGVYYTKRKKFPN